MYFASCCKSRVYFLPASCLIFLLSLSLSFCLLLVFSISQPIACSALFCAIDLFFSDLWICYIGWNTSHVEAWHFMAYLRTTHQAGCGSLNLLFSAHCLFAALCWPGVFGRMFKQLQFTLAENKVIFRRFLRDWCQPLGFVEPVVLLGGHSLGSVEEAQVKQVDGSELQTDDWRYI